MYRIQRYEIRFVKSRQFTRIVRLIKSINRANRWIALTTSNFVVWSHRTDVGTRTKFPTCAPSFYDIQQQESHKSIETLSTGLLFVWHNHSTCAAVTFSTRCRRTNHPLKRLKKPQADETVKSIIRTKNKKEKPNKRFNFINIIILQNANANCEWLRHRTNALGSNKRGWKKQNLLSQQKT